MPFLIHPFLELLASLSRQRAREAGHVRGAEGQADVLADSGVQQGNTPFLGAEVSQMAVTSTRGTVCVCNILQSIIYSSIPLRVFCNILQYGVLQHQTNKKMYESARASKYLHQV